MLDGTLHDTEHSAKRDGCLVVLFRRACDVVSRCRVGTFRFNGVTGDLYSINQLRLLSVDFALPCLF